MAAARVMEVRISRHTGATSSPHLLFATSRQAHHNTLKSSKARALQSSQRTVSRSPNRQLRTHRHRSCGVLLRRALNPLRCASARAFRRYNRTNLSMESPRRAHVHMRSPWLRIQVHGDASNQTILMSSFCPVLCTTISDPCHARCRGRTSAIHGRDEQYACWRPRAGG